MATPRIILCPGQGAQALGMGKPWFDRSPEAREVFERADRVLGARLGTTLSALCFSGPAERLNQTDVSQPAIYAASYACWRGLLAQWGAGSLNGNAVAEAGVVAAAGLSLGEYTALAVAGAFSFEDGLELVVLRGRAMQDAADAIRLPDGSPGSGMVALIGATPEQAEAVCDEARAGEVLVPANFNAPGQIVISGSIGACRRSAEVAARLGLRATPLTVAGAFHSPLMQPAADRLAAALRSTPIKPPACPVVSNVTGEPHAAGGKGSAGEAGRDAPGGSGGEPGRTIEDTIRDRLVAQLTRPVLWEQGCRRLISMASAGSGGERGEAGLHELAPGKTLAGLMRRIDKAAKVETHEEPAT